MSVLTIIEISLILYLTYWRDAFWGAVIHHNLHIFTIQLGWFTVASLGYVFVYGTFIYFNSMAAIKWREILTKKAFAVREQQIQCDNLNQRIQEDCSEYPRLMLNTLFGLGRALLYIVVFSITLYKFSNGWCIPVLILYSVIATLVAKWIAKPLITLNYQSQAAEATYRDDLIHPKLIHCILIQVSLAKQTKKLAYFQSFYGQLGVLIPLLLVAPTYFAGLMTFGLLMQITKIMDVILENLSYGINSFNDINRLYSSYQRLSEIKLI